MAPLKTILLNIQRLFVLVLCAVIISFVIISCWDAAPTSPETAQVVQPSATLPLAATEPAALPVAQTLNVAAQGSAANPLIATAGAQASQPISGALGSVSPTETLSVTTQSNDQDQCPFPLHLDLTGVPEQETLSTVLGCPSTAGSLAPVAINEFGSGPEYNRFMLWFSTDLQIYVLFADQTWLKYTDDWREGQPEISCNPTNGPRTTPPLPHRGFGKLWCTVDNIRENLGEIDRKERLCQHSVTQRFDEGYLLACFEDATIRYFRILDKGTWEMRQVQ